MREVGTAQEDEGSRSYQGDLLVQQTSDQTPAGRTLDLVYMILSQSQNRNCYDKDRHDKDELSTACSGVVK